MNNPSRLILLLGLIVMINLIAPIKTLVDAQYSNTGEERTTNGDVVPLNVNQFEIDITTWFLTVTGQVQNPLNLTYDEIKSMPAVTVFSEIICVGGATFITEGNWTGVQLSYLLTLAEVNPEAVDMIFLAADDFSSSLPVKEIMSRPDMLLAYEKDGEPLTPSDGFPVRVVAPGKWGYKWVKWVESIRVTDRDYLGFYEGVGYSDEADILGYSVTTTAPNTSETDQNTVTVTTIVTSSTTKITVPEYGIRGLVMLIILGLFYSVYKKRT